MCTERAFKVGAATVCVQKGAPASKHVWLSQIWHHLFINLMHHLATKVFNVDSMAGGSTVIVYGTRLGITSF